ncbi:MAG: hypothetical protein WCJ72_15080 [Chryseobacterium sp.]
MIKQLSERALNFIERQGKNKDYEIDLKMLEKHLNFYHLQNTFEILSFQKNFSGLYIQDVIIHIFTPKQVKEHKGINTYRECPTNCVNIN